MTITLISYSRHNMDSFENKENKSLEELKLKYANSDENSYEEFIPALDQRWCFKDYKYTLYMNPPSKNSNGEFVMGAKEDWVERMNLFIDDLNMLLCLDYHRFWSEVVFNNLSLSGVNSFLQLAPPFYLEDKITEDKDILKAFKRAHKLVFLVFLRLTTEKESEKTWMKKSTLGNILYNNFIISLPQLMDICLIYANDNFKEVFELVNKIIDIQPKYMNDIEKSTSFMCEVFSKLEKELTNASDTEELAVIANSSNSISSVELVNLILLVLDASYSVATFLKICPRAAKVYHLQQMESRIANFYGNTIPILSRCLSDHFRGGNDQDHFTNYQQKLNLCRHQLIIAANESLTSSLFSIFEERDNMTDEELKIRVDIYLNTISDCLSTDHLFVRDYNSAFPIDKELRLLSDVYPKIDTLKRDYILESINSLYDLPTKPKITVIRKGQNEPSSSAVRWMDEALEESEEQPMNKKMTGVELDSLISSVKDILPHLGDGFIAKCLEHFSYVSTDVINAVLENALPESLASLDMEMPIIPPENTEDCNHLPERVNIFDNDEFDIMTQDQVDTTRIHKGKRPGKHKTMFEMLNDKTDVNQLRDMYSKLSLVEHMENVDEYEDEYDDTYDDIDTAVGNEGIAEVEERRAFVIPRVLQQKKAVGDPVRYEEEDDDEEEETGRGSALKPVLFIENPADVRERLEQQRQDQRRGFGGRSRAAVPRSDVVGKPKGQGQDKDVVKSREFKNTIKAFKGNHNRRAMAAKKKRQGMLPM